MMRYSARTIEIYDGETGQFRMGPRMPAYVGQNFGSCAMYSDLYDEHIWYVSTKKRNYQGENLVSVMVRFDVATGKADRWPYLNKYGYGIYGFNHARRHMACGISFYDSEYRSSKVEVFEIEGGIR